MSTEKKSILVIDDDSIIRKLIHFHLSKNNYKVFSAESSTEAFVVLNESKVDLVLCDVGLDGMNGYEFCTKVREQEKYKTLPFIFVSAKTTMEDKEKGIAAGADDFITKPFNSHDLILKIQALIRRTEILTQFGKKEKQEVPKNLSDDKSKILLVDDDLSISKLFTYNLNKAGFICKTASDGREGFKLAKEFHPDIIISDIMMPELDGIEFRKLVLEDSELKNIPFIFLTAKGTEDDILEGYELGVTDYVIKTAGPKLVVAKVNAILNSLGKVKQKLFSDLHKAANGLRVKVVSAELPLLRNYEILQWHQPFEGIPGGDFIDYFEIENEKLIVILGDVMGKKWNAWYFAVAYAGYIRSAFRVALENTKDFSPMNLLSKVNNVIYKDTKISEVFATLSVLLLDSNSNIIRYCGAGDLPLIYKNSGQKITLPVQSNGMLLGFAEDSLYEDTILEMQDYDEIFIMSDGILESRNNNGEQFGSERLMNLITKNENDQNSIEYIKKNFLLFTNNKCEDDLSLLIIKRKRAV